MDAATYGVDTQFNTWDLNITPAAKDFVSITDASVGGTGQAIETTSLALGPRQADGSLPNVDFIKLAAGMELPGRQAAAGPAVSQEVAAPREPAVGREAAGPRDEAVLREPAGARHWAEQRKSAGIRQAAARPSSAGYRQWAALR